MPEIMAYDMFMVNGCNLSMVMIGLPEIWLELWWMQLSKLVLIRPFVNMPMLTPMGLIHYPKKW